MGYKEAMGVHAPGMLWGRQQLQAVSAAMGDQEELMRLVGKRKRCLAGKRKRCLAGPALAGGAHRAACVTHPKQWTGPGARNK